MTDEELTQYHAREMPKEDDWKREIIERVLTHEELTIEEKRRRSEKNQDGQSELSSVDDVKRDVAIDAFMDEGPARVTPQQIANAKKYGFWNLDPYNTVKPQHEWVNLPWYKAIFHWLKGRKVESRLEKQESGDWRDFMKQKNSEK